MESVLLQCIKKPQKKKKKNLEKDLFSIPQNETVLIEVAFQIIYYFRISLPVLPLSTFSYYWS